MILVYGKFDAEQEWQNENLATLPTFNTKAEIASNMEELLFPVAENGILITHKEIDKDWKEYIEEFGFKFNVLSIENMDIVDMRNSEFKCYAVNSEFLEIIGPLNRRKFPKLSDVIKVNGKNYSSRIAANINPYSSFIVTEEKQLLDTAQKLNFDFMIKEVMGVSGKGNLHIKSEREFFSIFRYLSSQIRKGKKLCVILEPFQYIATDFSSQYFICQDGSLKMLCVRYMKNRGAKYYGSSGVSKDFLNFLKDKQYFEKIENVLKRIYQDGYWGYICIDSAVLQSGEIVPVIEVNARMSMGLISYQIEKNFKNTRRALFRCMDIMANTEFNFTILKTRLIEKDLLVTKKEESGIFLASANTYNCNLENRRGRIYFYTVCESSEEEDVLLKEFNSIVSDYAMII